MRHSIMTIYDNNNIEITATEEHNEKDFFSGQIVDGIVLYCEQWKPEFDDFAGVSVLLKDNTLTILKNNLFTKKEIDDFYNKINYLKTDIKDFINEQEEVTDA